MAIMARWRMPPESWCGYSLSRRVGSGMPTRSSSSAARLRAASPFRPRWRPGHRALQDLGDLDADRDHRVQRGQRVLEDHGHPAAAQVAQLAAAHGEQVLAVQVGAAAQLDALAGQQPHQGERGDRLAAARLAHQAHDLALVDLEGDTVDRPVGPAAVGSGEGDRQFVD
jgi:hypothetical protein